MSRNIEKALGLNPLPMVVTNEDDDPKDVVDKEQLDSDVSTARNNVHDAIGIAQQALQDILNIAQQSQHPKAYEVLNTMIKTYADLSMDLANLQMKKQRLNGNKPIAQDDNKTVNNNLFVGSTAELQKMLEEMKNKEK